MNEFNVEAERSEEELMPRLNSFQGKKIGDPTL
jgi:hypothetical protein